jgi:hypothetical protein
VKIYGSVKGGLQRNSFKSYTEENPFLSSTPSIMNTNHKVKLGLGSRGTLGPNTSYDAGTSYSVVENMAFFVTDPTFILGNRFNLVYDDVRLLDIHAETGFQKTDELKFKARADYFFYTMTDEMNPWHKPALEATLGAQYNIADRVYLKGDVFVLGNYIARTYDEDDPINSSAEKMKPLVDVNLGAEYRYSKSISAFVNVNNLLATRYYRWYSYPSQRIHVLGGVSCSF